MAAQEPELQDENIHNVTGDPDDAKRERISAPMTYIKSDTSVDPMTVATG
jgi:hypothetical protein